MFFPILNSKNFELKMTKIAHIHHQTFFSHSKNISEAFLVAIGITP